MPVSILVVEDDLMVQALLRSALERMAWRADLADSGEAALPFLEREIYDLVLLDAGLPGISGLDLLRAGTGLQPDAQFVMISGEGGAGDAVEALRLGAFDCLPKPLDLDELFLVLHRALEERDRRRELARLRGDDAGRRVLIGESSPMRRLRELMQRVAPTRTTVLVTGETGTGKALVAREIHRLSDRMSRPFVPLHCAAHPESLLESELFGQVTGSFTGANASRRGQVEEAAGGTLFLDGVASLPPSLQAKLLRVLQDHRAQRVGANTQVPVDFRLIVASDVDLAGEVRAGRFQAELYHRLNVFPLAVPPLRERREDIPRLAAHFLQQLAREHGVAVPELSADALRRLESYQWPGNVRELASVVERALILHPESSKLFIELPRRQGTGPEDAMEVGLRESWPLERVEREYIHRTLDAVGGNQSKAARVLGIDRRTLSRRLSAEGGNHPKPGV